MDVRCERCKTEYEFDDARITEAGVTVKCTTCGHVFKVKKKALVVTVPVKPGEGDAASAVLGAPVASSGTGGTAPAAADKREWKVRQANGNIFTFKELTTLQKWIVERKVSRDDEISLTGETWKRLGNIAELASFFQVVEEAQKAAQLQALQTQGLLSPVLSPPAGNPNSNVPASATPPQPTSSIPPASMPVVGAPQPGVPAPMPPAPPPAPATAHAGPVAASPAAVQAPPLRAVGAQPRFVTDGVRSAARMDSDDDLAAAGIQKSGGAGKWVALLLGLAVLGGGGAYGYFNWYLPQHAVPSASGAVPPAQAMAPMAPAGSADPTGAADARDAERPSVVGANPDPHAEADGGAHGVAAAAGTDAGSLQGAAMVAVAPDAGVAADAGAFAAAVATDAGTTQLASATEAKSPSPAEAREARAEKKPRGDFDYWMAQGDRLRERERLEQALEAYGKAADMSPSRAEPYAGRGLVFLDLGQKEQAEAAFREALKLNPRYAVAVMGLAETYKAMGRKQDAVTYYQRYLDILPNGPEASVARSAIERLKE